MHPKGNPEQYLRYLLKNMGSVPTLKVDSLLPWADGLRKSMKDSDELPEDLKNAMKKGEKA